MKMPVAQAERPITLPRLTLAPVLGFDVTHIGYSVPGFRIDETGVGMSLGVRFGILDDLEVGATLVPLEFTPEFAYGNPNLYLTYRFLKGDVVELGATLRGTILTRRATAGNGITTVEATGGVIQPGIPARFHLGKSARLDAGVYVPISIVHEKTLPPTNQVAVGMTIPVEFLYDIIEPLHVAVNTGFGIATFKDAGHSNYIPLGFSTGYAIAGAKGPIVDIDGFFQWPELFIPGSNGTKTLPGLFTTGLEVTGYIYL